MPSALSWDLRSRIVSACQAAELTQVEIADMFQVHLKTVEKLWRHFRRTGSAEAKPHGGGVKAHWAGHEDELRRLLAEQSDHTLAEYVALLGERHQVVPSVPVLAHFAPGRVAGWEAPPFFPPGCVRRRKKTQFRVGGMAGERGPKGVARGRISRTA